MSNREDKFLNSLIGKEVTIIFKGSHIAAVKVEFVWHDEEVIGVKFRKEEEKPVDSTEAENVIKEKETLIYKKAIQSIDSGWKSTK